MVDNFKTATLERPRFVTAASLFDGHDVSINIMRRILQAQGVEVIHLGHNRSAQEVANAAICEDAHAVAISSYQGGHNEYFPYVRQLLDQAGGKDIRIFGGGGGVITPSEREALEKKGINKIYSPEDGTRLGLEGIVKDMIKKSQEPNEIAPDLSVLKGDELSQQKIGKVISYIENEGKAPFSYEEKVVPVLGITGTGGAGKSSLIDEILWRFSTYYPQQKVALLSIDPSKKKTGGALLGDRIRIGSASLDGVFIRSLATRNSRTELSSSTLQSVNFLKSQGFSLIIVETSGIGQSADQITTVADKCIYVMTVDYGASTQLEKIEMLESADFIALNKFERPRSEDALRDIRKQYRRNHGLFSSPPDEDLPIYPTMAAKFNDRGINALFFDIMKSFDFATNSLEKLSRSKKGTMENKSIIPPDRSQYLRSIAKACRQYEEKTAKECEKLKDYQALEKAHALLPKEEAIEKKLKAITKELEPTTLKELKEFDQTKKAYRSGSYRYQVRNKTITTATNYQSLSGNSISKIALPTFSSKADNYRFIRQQNLPGFFPYAGGIFPFKRKDEEPRRMFAGEGGPKRTNQRFHYLCKNDTAKRLSTAFDSVTLYGEDPHKRPDIYGKIGESGVSIATLDDMEELFAGFDLSNPNTSVSMTINGPAPIILAMFMNTAVKQQLGRRAEPCQGQGDYAKSARHYSGRHFKRRSSTKHLHLFPRVCPENDGRCAGILLPKQY